MLKELLISCFWTVFSVFGLAEWTLPALIILIAACLACNLYEPSFPLLVSEVMVATPSRKMMYNKGGHPNRLFANPI